MFKTPELYNKNNEIQRVDTRKILQQFEKYFSWSDGECVLDIGSGCGRKTTQILLLFLPDTMKCLIGADISEEMVEYAKKENQRPKVSYVVLDIQETDTNKMLNTFSAIGFDSGFDKIFSFFCFHWVKDYRQAVKNMETLLRPGGQGLVVFVAYGIFYDVWTSMSSKGRKWYQYFENKEDLAERFPLPFMNNVKEEYCSILKEHGLDIKECIVHETEQFLDPSSFQLFQLLKSIDPLIQHIPIEHQESYIKDVMTTLNIMTLEKYGKRAYIDKLLVVLFSKPTETTK